VSVVKLLNDGGFLLAPAGSRILAGVRTVGSRARAIFSWNPEWVALSSENELEFNGTGAFAVARPRHPSEKFSFDFSVAFCENGTGRFCVFIVTH